MKKWNDNEIEKLITLNKDGLSYYDISTLLGRTRQSVRIKLNKLGLFTNDKTYYEIILCKECGKDIKTHKKENRNFCSQSCSASFNNKHRKRKVKKDEQNKIRRERYHKTKTNVCLFCGKLVYDKYCGAKCRKEYEHQLIFIQIENNIPIQIGNNHTTHRWYKKYLISKYGEKCMECEWDKRNPYSNTSPIELEHIDGNSENNNLENLKLLCPNCHSLTPTYKALNKGNGRHERMVRYKNGKSF